jgi:outer membrane autotransporter protein
MKRTTVGLSLALALGLGCARLTAEDVFSNPGWITVPDVSNAIPFPSTISVSVTPPLAGPSLFLAPGTPLLTNTRVRLNGWWHSYTADTVWWVTGPTGATSTINNYAWPPNGTLLYSDAGPYFPATPLSVFNGTNPNGTWGLYIQDNVGWDSGFVSGGWDLLLTYTSAAPVRIATYASVTRTPNQRSTAANLDRIVAGATGDMLAVTNVLDFLTLPQFNNAMDQLHPEIFDAHAKVIFAGAQAHSSNLERRLHEMRWGLPGFDFASLFDDANGASYAADSAVRSDLGGDKPINSAKRWGFFALATGLTGDQDTQYAGGGVEQTGFSFTTLGGTVGADYRVDKNFIVGLAASFASSDVSLGRYDSQADVRSITVGPYVSYFNNGFYADAEVDVGFDEFQTDRRIFFPGINRTAKSEWDGRHVSAAIGGGYMFKKANWTLGPTVKAQYVNLWQDGFSEKEAGALNLHVDDRSVDSLRTELGFRAAYNAKFGWGSLVPEARARWAREHLQDDRGITSQFIGSGAGSFSVRAAEPSRDSAFAGAGLSAHVKKNITTFINYDVDVGRKDYLIHGGNLGFRVKF